MVCRKSECCKLPQWDTGRSPSHKRNLSRWIVFGDNEFGSFCANRNVVIEASLACTFPEEGKCPLLPGPAGTHAQSATKKHRKQNKKFFNVHCIYSTCFCHEMLCIAWPMPSYSVCLSACHLSRWYIVSKPVNIFSNILDPPFHFFRTKWYGSIQTGTPRDCCPAGAVFCWIVELQLALEQMDHMFV